jgi:preprotein translocase subunit SecA
VLEDIPAEEPVAATPAGAVEDGAPKSAEPARRTPAARHDPTVVGAGRAKKLSDFESGQGSPIGAGAGTAGGKEVDWSNVGRNDPCPCGSGKKYKKCHGA